MPRILTFKPFSTVFPKVEPVLPRGGVVAARQARDHQVKRLVQYVQQSPYPSLVIGDFNLTPDTEDYRYLAGLMSDVPFHLKPDAHLPTFFGSGDFVRLWKKTPPTPDARLDYIFSSERPGVAFSLHPKDYMVVADSHSDHGLVCANLSILPAN